MICKDCEQDLPLSEFWYDRKHDKPFARCKTCTKARRTPGTSGKRTPEQRAEYLRRKGKVSVEYVPRAERERQLAVKRAERKAVLTVCRFIRDAFKPPSDRSKIRGTREWYARASAEQIGALRLQKRNEQREKRRISPEIDRSRTKRWKREHPVAVARQNAVRQSRIEQSDDGTLTQSALGMLYANAKDCPYCGCFLHSLNKTLDHVTPVARGGAHSIHNVRICCVPCNTAKANRTPDEWQAAQREFKEHVSKSMG
jgi:5-methylcytosine-specific restriction endonuclease McrA